MDKNKHINSITLMTMVAARVESPAYTLHEECRKRAVNVTRRVLRRVPSEKLRVDAVFRSQ